VDKARVAKTAEALEKAGHSGAVTSGDFRHILDDKGIDALVCAAPNHWHAPAAILACVAGKHVYVEKPCSHTPQEGVWLVAAARKYDRRVQMGNQRRSWLAYREAVHALRDGIIGRVYLAKSWYHATRGSIGRGKAATVPAGLDYELWQGPAPRRPYRDNVVPYNWHWFWHWGNGELGNNGVHMIDLCRWGLGVTYPSAVTSAGGRYCWQDDQETPDTHLVTVDFPTRQSLVWEGLSCNGFPQETQAEAMFHGEAGTLVMRGGGYAVLDLKGKETKKVSGPMGDEAHLANFVAAVRGEGPLNSEIEEGHLSTLLCHLGNIAQRTTRALVCDPKNGRPREPTAQALWSKDYAPGWQTKLEVT
jgi:predicted dehydrogenase